MRHIVYKPVGVCSSQIDFDLDDENKIHNLKFTNGCPGNLSAISRLLEGDDAKHAMEILQGNNCRNKGTSCADQLSKAIAKALNE